MRTRKYLKDKCNDVHKFVSRREQPDLKVTTYIGDGVDYTQELDVADLRLFIDRDIFMSIREELMPSIDYSVVCQVNNLSPWPKITVIVNDINCQIVDLDRFEEYLRDSNNKLTKSEIMRSHHKYLNDLGQLICIRLKQILWKYNVETISFQPDNTYEREKRFDFEVLISEKLLRDQTKELLKLQSDTVNEPVTLTA